MALYRGPNIRSIGRRQDRRQDRRWARSWSPQQITSRLVFDFPDDESMRISDQAIYQALYVQSRGALGRELVACLRTGRVLRVPRARTRGHNKKFVRAEVMIRPAAGPRPRTLPVPGHWQGPRLASSAIGTQVQHHPLHDAAAPAYRCPATVRGPASTTGRL